MITTKKNEMDNRRVLDILQDATTIVEQRPGVWRVRFDGLDLLVNTDEQHNRIRIMAPIVEHCRLNETDLELLMTANFDRALDARYALAGGYLWSVFMHPLNELTDRLFLEGLRQVKALADNYGGSYASTRLRFTGGQL